MEKVLGLQTLEVPIGVPEPADSTCSAVLCTIIIIA